MITGAAQGLGAAIARVFARAGADLVLVDLSAEGFAEVGAACGGRAKLITADLADAEAKGRRPQSDAGAVLFCLN